MTFFTEVESAEWDSERQVWIVHLRDIKTGKHFEHECRILYSAVGVLVEPKYPNIPGKETFKGDIFHTARWKDGVDLRDKNVVVVGNGCGFENADLDVYRFLCLVLRLCKPDVA